MDDARSVRALSRGSKPLSQNIKDNTEVGDDESVEIPNRDDVENVLAAFDVLNNEDVTGEREEDDHTTSHDGSNDDTGVVEDDHTTTHDGSASSSGSEGSVSHHFTAGKMLVCTGGKTLVMSQTKKSAPRARQKGIVPRNPATHGGIRQAPRRRRGQSARRQLKEIRHYQKSTELVTY